MKATLLLRVALCSLIPEAFAATPDDGFVLPFPPTPSASKAGPTLPESIPQRRVEPDRLPKGAPNVLIVLIDDVGFGTPDTQNATFDIGTDLDSPVSLDPPHVGRHTVPKAAERGVVRG